MSPLLSNAAVDRHPGAGLDGDALRIPGQPEHGAEPASRMALRRAKADSAVNSPRRIVLRRKAEDNALD